jgi:uncharacterized protein (UPF0332 family)
LNEIYFARETLSIVQSLLQIGLRTQWMYRVMLSRLYYAAHHLGRLLLRNIGIDANQWRGEVHRRVIRELGQHYVASGAMNTNTLNALERLRIYRVWADYNMALRIRERHVRSALNLFTVYLDECNRILEVI